MMPIYAQLLLFSIIIPFIFSFHSKINFFKHWISFIKANLITLIPFIIWDELFTRNGIWGFNKEHLYGIYIANLPLEEILFFIIIPYCCVFTYYVMKKFESYNNPKMQKMSLTIGAIILITGIILNSYLYTTITFISLGILLILVSCTNSKLLPTFYLTYLIITITFFIIINGTLTGGTLENAPVWYNDSENLNIRIWTIPIEDFFYSMLLMLSNIYLFEIFKKKTEKNY